MTLDRFHYLPSISCNALKAVSNRIFDAHLTYNWCHFISLRWMLLFTTIVSLEPSCSSLLLLSTRMAFLCLCLFVDVNPTFLSLSLSFLSISQTYYRHILDLFLLDIICCSFSFQLFAVFHRNFIAVYTSKERIANAILQMLLFLPDLHPPRVP